MSKFLGYTNGLQCALGDRVVLAKVEYSETTKGVTLQAVSGRNLSQIGKAKTIDRVQYDERPQDACDGLVETVWALKQLGLDPFVVR